MMSFGQQLKVAREAKGLSQLQLASNTQLSLSAICSMESGRHDPSLKNLLLMTAFLDVRFEFRVHNKLITLGSAGTVRPRVRYADLTDKQRQCYEFIRDHVKSQGMPPTVASMAREFKLSKSYASGMIKTLAAKGYLERDNHKRHALKLLRTDG